MNGNKVFSLGERSVGPGHPCLVIAEIGQAHDGSLGTAHAYIDAAARAGVDVVKFQMHIAQAESTPQELFRVPGMFPQDATRFDYWHRMEFTPEQWAGLDHHAREQGLIFLATPFSLEAVELLERLQIAGWKIGSGDLPMLERIARTGKPVLISSGMSPWSELDEAVSCVKGFEAPLALFQCTTSYPCPPEGIGLNVLEEMRRRYGCPIGLSDHSGAIYGPLAAVASGADLVEVHIVFSRECFGPDVTSSITTPELAQLVDGVRFIRKALQHPLNKDEEAAARTEQRTIFSRSLVAAHDLPAGCRLTAEDIALKKPGTGMPARDLKKLIGRILKRDYMTNEFFKEKDIE